MNNEEITKKTLAEELIENAEEFKNNLENMELTNEELKLRDDIVNHMIMISKKGKLECSYAVGRTSGYNIRKIDFDKLKNVLESDPYCLNLEIKKHRTSFDVIVLYISACKPIIKINEE